MKWIGRLGIVIMIITIEYTIEFAIITGGQTHSCAPAFLIGALFYIIYGR